MHDKRTSGVWMAVAILLLPMLYVGGYLVIVKRDSELPYVPKLPEYRWGGAFAARVFAPIHALDRKVRPDYWEEWKANPLCP